MRCDIAIIYECIHGITLWFMFNLIGTAKIREARITDEQRERMAAKANDNRPMIKKLLEFPKAIFQLVSKCKQIVIFIIIGSM